MHIEHTLLRSSEHRARCEHYCDNCEKHIFPGDIYYVTVIARGPHYHRWLYVRKEHVQPGCPYDPNDYDEIVCQEWDLLPLAA